MKATIDKEGKIEVIPENSVEGYALKARFRENGIIPVYNACVIQFIPKEDEKTKTNS